MSIRPCVGGNASQHSAATSHRGLADAPGMPGASQGRTVPAVGAGRKRRNISRVYEQQAWRPPGATRITGVSGKTTTDVHEQLLDTAARAGHKPMRDVICVVDDGSTALEPPAS